MARRTHGKTASGKPITDELVEKVADEAKVGYDVDVGAADVPRSARRPPASSRSGSTPSYAKRSPSEPSETTSSVIRKALRKYLQVG